MSIQLPSQIARDLELNQKSAWYMQQRIRVAMEFDQAELLTGIIEADETLCSRQTRDGQQEESESTQTRTRIKQTTDNRRGF